MTSPQAIQTTVDPAPAPAAIVEECDLATGLRPIPAPRAGIEALVLVRLFTEPIGMLDEPLPAGGLSAHDLSRAIAARFEPELRDRFHESGLEWTGELPSDGLEPPRRPRFLTTRERVMHDGPSLTVAICTHDRADSLKDAIGSVCAQDYERLRILVVDNAPSNDSTRRLVSELSRTHNIDYALERRSGLSWARNRAIELATGDVLAWVDDDEECDPWWALEIARGFTEVASADAVTGTVIPIELETPSQLLFERYGGVRRARGFTRAVFSPATRHLQSPLYPLPPFGIGANMAFRLAALERIGGFDCALGAGTLTQTAEDTAAMSTLLLDGGTIVYQPTAIVRHRNRRESGVLHDLVRAHGRGLGAYYTSMLAHRPSCALELLRLAPQALRDQFSPSGQRRQKLGPCFPNELVRANRIGLLQGPVLYGRARARARRLRAVGDE